MSEYATLVAILVATAFLALAALAALRMPDVYCRLSASTKAVTFGAGLMLLAASLAFDDGGITTRALAGIAFYFITSPIAAHVLARAAHMRGTRLWEGTLIDELEGPDPADGASTRDAGREPAGRT